MARFLTELNCYLKHSSDSIWIVDTPLIYESDLIGQIEVPYNFETDFASVPRVPFIYDAFGGVAHRESVIHDYLFRKDSTPCVPFMAANRIFLEAMKSRGKSFVTRWGMFAGVCMGGYFSYHKRNVNDKL